MMKWFMASNEASLNDPQFFDQIICAVVSAKTNTTLQPFLIYDGNHNSKTELIASLGVTILNHRLSFYSELEKYLLENQFDKRIINVRSGAFLRYEIPQALERHGIEDEFIFYSDCDVLFLKDLELTNYRPKYLAACGHKIGGYTRMKIGGEWHFNSGILLMNVNAVYQERNSFVNFIKKNGLSSRRGRIPFMQKNLYLSDQVTINLYYKNKINRLPLEYNWHPSKGVNPGARIVHFNGLKWTQWKDYTSGDLGETKIEKYRSLVDSSPEGYEHYSGIAQGYRNRV